MTHTNKDTVSCTQYLHRRLPTSILSSSPPLVHSGHSYSFCSPAPPPLLSVAVATYPLQPWRPASRIWASLTLASSLYSRPWEAVSTANTSGRWSACRVPGASRSVNTALTRFVCVSCGWDAHCYVIAWSIGEHHFIRACLISFQQPAKQEKLPSRNSCWPMHGDIFLWAILFIFVLCVCVCAALQGFIKHVLKVTVSKRKGVTGCWQYVESMSQKETS